MDIELCRTFLEVERLRHFGRAAAELFVTQGAVSSRIRTLEEHLGAALFVRLHRQIDLTPEGHRFKRYAERLIAEWRKARHDVALGGAAAQLAVGGTFRVWDAGLQEWLHDVHRAHPDLGLILETHTPDTLVRRLLDGQLDMGFIMEPPQLDVLQTVEVGELELILVSTRPHSTVDESMSKGYIMVDWGLSYALQHRRLYPDADEPVLRMSNADVALDFMLEFGGSAYLATREVIDEVREGTLFAVRDAQPICRTIHAAHLVRGSRLELIQSVIQEFEYRVTLPKRRRRSTARSGSALKH